MEYSQLGSSGLKVSVLAMGTMTFGGKGVFAKVGDVSLDEVRRQADELRASRARIVEATDAERRRIERDLHDGAQQHLVALAVSVRGRQASHQAPSDPGRTRAAVAAFGS